MIVHPENWSIVGQPIEIQDIEETILQVLLDINCPNLSFSGGLDSSLMLYYMTRIFDKISAFTIGFPETHPDIKYSRLVAKEFGNVTHEVYIPNGDEIEKKPEPDAGVKLFYRFLAERQISRIIACDGIDEFMCGYYDHQQYPDEETYFNYLHRLRDEQLKPLDENSRHIKVYLPYLDEVVLHLLIQIPLSDKIDSRHRKKVMVRLAEGKVPRKVIERWKYGFCDALKIKDSEDG